MSEEHVSVFCFEFYHEKAETLQLGLFLLDFMIIVFSLWAHGCYTIHVFASDRAKPHEFVRFGMIGDVCGERIWMSKRMKRNDADHGE